MRFEVTTLGTGAALPARGRFPSAQLLNANERLYLIDCGEGTQERLRQAEVNFNRIGRILISHLHGDHYLGLMGLISSMHLQGRTEPLDVHGPAELKEVIDLQLRVSRTWLRFPLRFHAVAPVNGGPVFTDDRVDVTALALKHRIPTTGYRFTEHPAPRKLRLDKLGLVPHYLRNAVKAGEDLVLPDGTRVPNAELTHDPLPPRSYAYCSDTAFTPELVPFLAEVDLLYHEATFTDALAARAKETFHSTARQAATIAREARVKRLLLGHFSSRYKTNDGLLAEARSVFPDTLLAEEGRTFAI
ncbi:MAG: ribonuclease Z [Bacteroidetes bacterium]|nr:ribonuclease Z [Bacteroidota bacterium]